MLDELLTDVMAGTSRVTVLRGDAGVGKSALLGYLSHRVRSCQVATAVGMESEMELAYSSLHQLCAPMLDHLDLLPMRQRDALSTVFGLGVGAVPDRFLAVILPAKYLPLVSRLNRTVTLSRAQFVPKTPRNWGHSRLVMVSRFL